jgi:hypothetical protein
VSAWEQVDERIIANERSSWPACCDPGDLASS